MLVPPSMISCPCPVPPILYHHIHIYHTRDGIIKSIQSPRIGQVVTNSTTQCWSFLNPPPRPQWKQSHQYHQLEVLYQLEARFVECGGRGEGNIFYEVDVVCCMFFSVYHKKVLRSGCCFPDHQFPCPPELRTTIS